MKKEYIHIVVLLLTLHLFLSMWKAWAPLNLSLSQPFEMKMATIGFLLMVKPLSYSDPFEMKMVTMMGMCTLAAIVCFISREEKTDLSVWPKKLDGTVTAITLLSVLMIASTAVCFTNGAHGFWLLLYSSLVTPLFEELLFRGHIYAVQERIHRNPYHVVAINAMLFAVWHLGYIVNPLLCGEWMALSKLVVGLYYGLALAFIRCRTKSTFCCVLAHGALNSFFG